MRNILLIASCGLISISSIASAAVDHQKIIGKWCFTHMEMGGQKSVENIPYEFFENGEFSFKNNSSASRIRKGKYKLDGNKLNIGGLAPGGLEILELSDSKLVAKGSFSTMRFFERGTCK